MPRYHVEIWDLYFSEMVVDAVDRKEAYDEALDILSEEEIRPYFLDEHTHEITEVPEDDVKWRLTRA